MKGNPTHGAARRDFQNRCGFDTDVRLAVMIARLTKLLSLLGAQLNLAAENHDLPPENGFLSGYHIHINLLKCIIAPPPPLGRDTSGPYSRMRMGVMLYNLLHATSILLQECS